ncbi:MAG: hypothetical protein KGS72_01755 [Cyanobacteria bacterium REEB67]|nr:hypothetical protein [Cyanobacteria bacterium REEB67]
MTRWRAEQQRFKRLLGFLGPTVALIFCGSFNDCHLAAVRAAEPQAEAAAAVVAKRSAIGRIKVDISEQKVGNRTYTVGAATFPVEQRRLWELLTDYGRAAKTFANLARSEVLERKGNVVTIHQIVKPGYFPFTFDYVVDLVETPISLLEWHRVSGSFAAYEGAWQLEPIVSPGKSASTHVTYRVYLDANKFIPQWLMRRSLHGYLPEVFDSLRKALNKT